VPATPDPSKMESGFVSLRLIESDASEMAKLQHVFESAPKFAEAVTGMPPGLADTQSLCSILPEGKTYEDKFVFGIFFGNEMVGCADVIRGYPGPTIAMLWLLLIAETFQRRSIGRAAYGELERRIRAWGTCDRVRIGVVETNAAVMPFWQKLGFERTGESRPYRHGSVLSECIYFEKPLRRMSSPETDPVSD
jgi:GNAT superfamily N-acetyltransferase